MLRRTALVAIAALSLGAAAAACGAAGYGGVPIAGQSTTQSTPQSRSAPAPIGDDAPTPLPGGHVPAPSAKPSTAAPAQVQACGLPAPARPARVVICQGT